MGDSLDIFYDVSLYSSGWNMAVKQATGSDTWPTKPEGHMWVIQKHNFYTTHIGNTRHNCANTYIRARIILHIKAKDMPLKIHTWYLGTLFLIVLINI